MREEWCSRPRDPDGLVLEAWGQGLMVGSLLIMAAVTLANMKMHVLLHKLILAELLVAIPHGTYIFVHDPAYGWYLSSTAIGLSISWSLHNVIAWIKNKPFLSRRGSISYIATVILVRPYWVVGIYANFTYFNNINTIYKTTRPMEPLFRDPWWIFTTTCLFWIIKREYGFSIVELVVVSPRFGIMLVSMCLSIIFVIVETCSVLGAFHTAVILDDFKTALDHIRAYRFQVMTLGDADGSFFRGGSHQQGDFEAQNSVHLAQSVSSRSTMHKYRVSS